MSDIALCQNAEKINCTLRNTCRRFLEKASKIKQRRVKGDFYTGECYLFKPLETVSDMREQFNEAQREYYQDNKT